METHSNMPYLFVRGLRHVEHTVFNVQDGQKTYFDPQFGRRVAYSSGQQVKRSLLDTASERLSESRAPVTFNYTLETGKKGKQTLSQGEPWSPCDPTHADQLLGGWMRAQAGGGNTVKRRSPLSISAMRPLHPLLSNTAQESASFDRSDRPEHHPVRVINKDGEELGEDEVNAFLESNNRTLPRRKWIPEEQVGRRAHGLFVYDVAVDLRRLFTVSLNQHEPELDEETIAKLREQGWSDSSDGYYLTCPKARRDEIIPALAHALLHWRVTSNQSRTFSPQPTLAVAISDNANRVVGAIRADLDVEGERPSATPIIEPISGAHVFTALPAKGYVAGVTASADALDEAEAMLGSRLSAFDYDAL